MKRVSINSFLTGQFCAGRTIIGKGQHEGARACRGLHSRLDRAHPGVSVDELSVVARQGGDANTGQILGIVAVEIMEQMPETFKVARRNSEAISHGVPIPNDVWDCLNQISIRQQKSMTDIFEQLVVEKVAELGLVPRK